MDVHVYLSQAILLQLTDILLMYITKHQLEFLGQIQKKNYFTLPDAHSFYCYLTFTAASNN